MQLPSWVVRKHCVPASSIQLEVERWTHQISYAELVSGMAVSLYQTWRFPYVATCLPILSFLLFYLIFQFFIGFPLHYLGLCIGSLSKNGAVSCWSRLPAGKGLMVSFTIMAILNALTLSVWLAVGLRMFMDSALKSPPWMDCLVNATIGCANRYSASFDDMETPSESYIHDCILNLERYESSRMMFYGFGEFFMPFVFALFLAWFLVWAVLYYGIYSLSKITLLTLILNVCCWLIMVVGSFKLNKANDGFSELSSTFSKQFKWIKEDTGPNAPSALTAIVYALKQCLMETFLSVGVLIFLGKHARRSDRIRPASVLCCFIATLTGLLCLILCIAVLATIGGDFPDSEVKLYHGPTTPLALYAEMTARLHGVHSWAAVLFGTFCLSALYTVGLLTLFVIKSLQQCRFNFVKKKTRHLGAFVCAVFFLITAFLFTIPTSMYILALMDQYVCTKPSFLLSAFTCIVVSYIHGNRTFLRNLRVIKNEIVPPYYPTAWLVIPVVLIIFALLDLLVSPPTVYKKAYPAAAKLFFTLFSYAIVLPVFVYLFPFLMLVVRSKMEERAEKRILQMKIRADMARREQEGRLERLERAKARDRQKRADGGIAGRSSADDTISSEVFSHG